MRRAVLVLAILTLGSCLCPAAQARTPAWQPQDLECQLWVTLNGPIPARGVHQSLSSVVSVSGSGTGLCNDTRHYDPGYAARYVVSDRYWDYAWRVTTSFTGQAYVWGCADSPTIRVVGTLTITDYGGQTTSTSLTANLGPAPNTNSYDGSATLGSGQAGAATSSLYAGGKAADLCLGQSGDELAVALDVAPTTPTGPPALDALCPSGQVGAGTACVAQCPAGSVGVDLTSIYGPRNCTETRPRESYSCQFSGYAWVNPFVPAILLDPGGFTTIETGSYSFSLDYGGSATCVHIDPDTGQSGNSKSFAVTMYGSGGYGNRWCGFENWSGHLTVDSPTYDPAFEGPLDFDYNIDEAGAITISGAKNAEHAPPASKGYGDVRVSAQDDDGNSNTRPCVDEDVTVFKWDGAFALYV